MMTIGVMALLGCLTGCGYQKAPMAPDPYNERTFLGNDWPIGDGRPEAGPNIDSMAGTVQTEE